MNVYINYPTEYYAIDSFNTHTSSCSFQSRGIGVMNAAAVGMGLLTANAHPSWHPASKEMKELCTSVARLCQVKKNRLA